MRLLLLPAVLLIIVNILIDYYIYRCLRQRFRSHRPALWQFVTALLFQLAVIVAILLPRRDGNNDMLLTIMWILYGYLSIYAGKFLFVVVDILSRVPRLFGKRRLRWLSVTGVVAGVAVFLVFWWGALINRYSIRVNEVDVAVAGLPESFDGFRIAQISDLHTGTFGTDTAFVSKLVDRVNLLHPDVIVFTGDIVNSRSSELIPHTSPLSRLSAPRGVYSILGNHDYGDYSNWPSPESKKANLEELKVIQRDMGWNLLLNKTAWLRNGSDSIALIGVENIGDPPFKIYGSLAKAYPTLADSVTKVLLTHNPAHWSDSIAGKEEMRIPLTLSGHTHAMQIEIAGWSPAKWRYDTWGGMYCDPDSTHTLYVNIGDGTVGFPARIGATPEITVLTLRKKN